MQSLIPDGNTAETPAPSTESANSSENPNSNVLRNVLLVVAIAYVIVSLYLILDTRSQLAAARNDERKASESLSTRLNETEQQMKASTETLARKLGMTQQELQTRIAERADELAREQHAAERRLAEQQTAVSGEVAGVKTDLGSTKTDLEATKTDLESTKAKLEHTIGDLGVQSGLIAHTQGDLDELKRRGERNYYEFTLQKGARPTPVSTVSLQLKKSDPKHNRFTMSVVADDKTIEKKDRTVAEPMQFITGRDHLLYEVVVMTVDKNKVTGYLATPKSAPTPVNVNQ